MDSENLYPKDFLPNVRLSSNILQLLTYFDNFGILPAQMLAMGTSICQFIKCIHKIENVWSQGVAFKSLSLHEETKIY